MKTIKQIRRELRSWGQYWARMEQSEGYARKSNVDRLKEVCELGAWISSDLHLFSQAIEVPSHLKDIDNIVSRLSESAKLAMTGKYIKRKSVEEIRSWGGFHDNRSVEFWIRNAESAVLAQS